MSEASRITRVAVTGATGFIGRHVVADLLRRGIRPVIVRRPGAAAVDAAPDAARGAHHVVELDIADPPADAFERLGRPQLLVHLAWGGLPNYRSAHHLEQELPAQRAFLTALLAAGLPALTVAGTCFEYGLQSGALREDLPDAPVTVYGQAKVALRRALEAIHAERPFAFTWGRFFYLHGEGQAPGSLLPLLEAAIARGDATFDMSGGAQERDYLPVDVAARYLVALGLGGRDNGIVNICSGRPITVLELVQGVLAEHGSSIALNLGRYPYPEHEPMSFWGDPAKLDRCLGEVHEPRV